MVENNEDDKRKNKLLPWSEKYRPQTLQHVFSHEKLCNVLLNYKKNNTMQNLLFYGPPGTGKTSTITAFAKEFYREDFHDMVLILNASEERGIETVRNRIKQFSTSYGFSQNKNTPQFKLIILDEIDEMTHEAQDILKRIMEQYILNIRFCFICNYIKKINPAIKSRCVLFRFRPISHDELFDFIVDVCDKEELQITKKAIEILIRKSGGDLRKILNILQSAYMHNDLQNNKENFVNETTISKLLSSPGKKVIIEIFHLLQNKDQDFDKIFEDLNRIIKEENITLLEIINNIHELCVENVLGQHEKHPISKYSIEQLLVIITKLNKISINLSYCNNEYIQIGAFISIFYDFL